MTKSSSMRFTQPCPTCGRRIDVRASLMGHTIACQHCKAEFVADPNQERATRVDTPSDLMERVERALAMESINTETSQPANL